MVYCRCTFEGYRHCFVELTPAQVHGYDEDAIVMVTLDSDPDCPNDAIGVLVVEAAIGRLTDVDPEGVSRR